MKRREFVIAARRPAWPLAEHARQAAIGFLNASPGPFAYFVAAFRHGLPEMD